MNLRRIRAKPECRRFGGAVMRLSSDRRNSTMSWSTSSAPCWWVGLADWRLNPADELADARLCAADAIYIPKMARSPTQADAALVMTAGSSTANNYPA